MREHFGPGWRMYFVKRGKSVIVMINGGNKASQALHVVNAIRLAEEIKV